MTALLTTNLGATPLLGRGKVRDLYAVGDDLLLVATDRISAFDHVLATGIPGKGKILTQISLFWFDLLKDLVPNHLITADVAPVSRRACSPMPINWKAAPCWSSGPGCSRWSAWRAATWPVRAGRSTGPAEPFAAFRCPPGLLDGSRLPEPLYTPATKSQDGEPRREHLLCRRPKRWSGAADAAELRRLTLAIYRRAAAHAESRGLILADTKFEFGRTAEGIILADEVLTPDSSRFWEAAAWKPGGAQPSFDKQFVRDYLESIHWNKQAPAPGLPDEVVERTQAKYLEAFRRLTGRESQFVGRETERAV